MKVLIEIPNCEFADDIANKFQDYFKRVMSDIADGTLCGNYEMETTEMFLASFKRMQTLPDNGTNGDMIKAMFPNVQVIKEKHRFMNFLKVSENWWNAPYKGSEV